MQHLIAEGGLPISIVEQPWFRKFMKTVVPQYSHTADETVVKQISTKSEKFRQILKNNLAGIAFRPSMTVDCWTGRNYKAFMAGTVHYVENTKLCTALLFFRELEPPHTAVNILQKFEEYLMDFDLVISKVVTDNAANMKKAFKLRLWKLAQKELKLVLN